MLIENASQSQNICYPTSLTSAHYRLRVSPFDAILCAYQTRETMRLIERQMINAIQHKLNWRKDNTEVLYSPSRDVSCVYLHNNLIATIDNNSVEIYDGGRQSNTTKSRLNALINGLCDGMNQGVYQHKFEWFIQDTVNDDRNVIPFQHGYTFSRV